MTAGSPGSSNSPRDQSISSPSANPGPAVGVQFAGDILGLQTLRAPATARYPRRRTRQKTIPVFPVGLSQLLSH